MIETVSVGKPSMSSQGNAATISASRAPALKTTAVRISSTPAAAMA